MADDQDKKDAVNPTEGYEAKSTAQLDAERRVKKQSDETPLRERVVEHFAGVNPTYGVQEDGGYIGVSPEYRNAADKRQEPFNPKDGWTEQLATAPADDAGEKTVPFVEEHLGTGSPKVAESGPVTSTSTVAPEATTATTKSSAPAPRSSGTK